MRQEKSRTVSEGGLAAKVREFLSIKAVAIISGALVIVATTVLAPSYKNNLERLEMVKAAYQTLEERNLTLQAKVDRLEKEKRESYTEFTVKEPVLVGDHVALRTVSGKAYNLNEVESRVREALSSVQSSASATQALTTTVVSHKETTVKRGYIYLGLGFAAGVAGTLAIR